MQNESDRKTRFKSQGDTIYENSIIPKRYGAIFEYNKDFYDNKKIVDLGCGFGGGTSYISDKSKNLGSSTCFCIGCCFLELKPSCSSNG